MPHLQEGHESSLVSAQQDKLCLLKLEPASLVAYILYCRACLQFQQVKVRSGSACTCRCTC